MFKDTLNFQCYLPLAHIMEFMCHLFMAAMGCPVGYGTPFTLFDGTPGLTNDSKGDLTLIKPEMMIGVPLMLDRIRKLVENKIKVSEQSCTQL